MGIAFYIGTLPIHWYGIMIMVAISTAVVLATLEAKRLGEVPEDVLQLALFVVPLGIIGARLYHVIDKWDFYIQNPTSILGFQGLGIFGAVIGGAIGLIAYTKWKKLSTLKWMDIIAPGVILAQAIGRWGNFFNQELYGYPTDLPWGIFIDIANRLPGYESFTNFHPLFFYEFMWNLLGFGLLLIVGRKLKHRLLNGDIFFLYVIYYSIGRFFLEGLKISVWTIVNVPTARWITGIAIIASIVVITYRRYRVRESKRLKM